MKIIAKIFIFCAFLGLIGCSNLHRDAQDIAATLVEQQTLAEAHSAELARLLKNDAPFDSIWALTRQEDGVLYYIFTSGRMVYWSDNWLTAREVMLTRYDTWTLDRMDNAFVASRWTSAGTYNILSIIPIKYAYSLQNPQLPNTYIAPFSGKTQYLLSRTRRDNSEPICQADGSVFAYLYESQDSVLTADRPTVPTAPSQLAQSFSYQPIFDPADSTHDIWDSSHARVRVYIIIMAILMLMLMAWGVWVLFHYHGFVRLPMRLKLMTVMVTMLLFVFLYVFMMSMRYVRNTYAERQVRELETRCRYIQSSLQQLYYWDINLTPDNTRGLNVDLRDLSFTYLADIHVYDMQGTLVGSSTPYLFDYGLQSRHIAAEPFFTGNNTMVRHEQIGDMRYLCAYTPFYNGVMVPIGYIAVPSFVSSDEMVAEIDGYMARLLPPYVIALILVMIVSYIFTRTITYQLTNLSENMRRLRLGQHNRHIEYNGRDELGELVARYNEMVDELEESTQRLAQTERQLAWRTMARQIAHEINNPLTPMKLRIQQLQRLRMEDDPRFDSYFRQSADLLIEQIDSLSRIATSFSAFAKMPEVRPGEVDVARVLSTTIEMMRENEEHIPVRYVGPDSGVLCVADPALIGEVFTNIIKNAIQALGHREDGDVIIVLREETVKEQRLVSISISDNGPGIPEEIRDKVFMPNFTTKSTGAGLGLAISKNIVEGSNGTLRFDTSDKGTTFYIHLRQVV